MRLGNPFKQLDRVLRGEGTRSDDLRGGRLPVSARAMAWAVALLGGFYGACMGSFNLFGGHGYPLQIVSSALKVPALFLLTILVTFPSLYVFNALVGGRLSLTNMLRLILAAVGVMIAVLAGFGTIVAFFNLTGSSYPFVLLLNVVVFGVSGLLGLGFLLQTLRRLTEPEVKDAPAAPPSQAPESVAQHSTAAPPPPVRPGALTRVQSSPATGSVKAVFRIWVVVFALVGAQMSWVLRPFVGSYAEARVEGDFEWFRERGGNFFERVWWASAELLGVAPEDGEYE